MARHAGSAPRSIFQRRALAGAGVLVSSAGLAHAQTWNLDNNGNWSVAANWLPAGIPDAANAAPVFGNVITAARTVTVNQNVSVGSLSISTQAQNASYTIAGANRLLQFSGNANTITIAANNANFHTIGVNLRTSNSDLNIVNNSTRALTFTGTLFQDNVARKLNITGPVYLGGPSFMTGEVSVAANSFVGFSEARSLGNGNAAINLASGSGITLFRPANPPQPVVEKLLRPIKVAGDAQVSIGGSNLSPNLVLEVGGVISGTAPVLFTGNTNLVNNNTYVGDTELTGGTTSIGSDKAFGAAANKITLTNGSLGALNNFTSARAISVLGQGRIDTAGKNVTLSGVISSANVGILLGKTGAGTLTLTGTNTFKGEVAIAEGTLSISKAVNLGSTDLVSFNGGTLLATDSMTLAQTFGVSAAGGSVSVAAGKTLEVNAIRNAGQLNGGTLVKIGGGELDVLGNAGQALKRIDVNAGTLGLGGGGVLTLTDGLFVDNARVSGKGKVTGPSQFTSKAKVKPGNSPGLLTFDGPALFIGGNEFEIDINSANGIAGGDTGWGLLNVTSTLTFSGASPADPMVVSLRSLDLANNQWYLADFDPGQFYAWTFATADQIVGFESTPWVVDTSGFWNLTYGGEFSVVRTGNQLQLLFTPVPAPAGLGLLGLAGTLAVRRRR